MRTQTRKIRQQTMRMQKMKGRQQMMRAQQKMKDRLAAAMKLFRKNLRRMYTLPEIRSRKKTSSYLLEKKKASTSIMKAPSC